MWPDLNEQAHSIGEVQVGTLFGTDLGWHIKLKTSSQDSTWCIDTGAQVFMMPAYLLKLDIGQLRSPDCRLPGPGDQLRDFIEFADIKVAHGHTQIWEKVYVAQTSNLLRMPAAKKHGLIHDIPKASPSAPHVRRFPKLFIRLGKLEGEQTSLLKSTQKSFSLSVPCYVLVPLLGK